MQRVEAPRGLAVRWEEGVRVVWISGNVELATVAANEIVYAFVQCEGEMRVELSQEERQRGGEQLLPLLVKSRNGKGICAIVKEFEKFDSGGVALHGDEKAQEVFEVELPIAGKIGDGIFGEAPRVFRHLGNVAPDMRFRPLWQSHGDILLVIEVGILFQLQGPHLITKLLNAAAQKSSFVKRYLKYLSVIFRYPSGDLLGWAQKETGSKNVDGVGRAPHGADL